MGLGAGEAPNREFGATVLDGQCEAREKRHAGAPGDHLGQGGQARGAKIELAPAGRRAVGERLVAEAVAVVEEQEPGAAQLLGGGGGARPHERVAGRRGVLGHSMGGGCAFLAVSYAAENSCSFHALA